MNWESVGASKQSKTQSQVRDQQPIEGSDGLHVLRGGGGERV